ncbi:hypothetical protein V8G54_030909 [Vigna mungo]|uniref:Uncharacterized protein n=1 Tax=Vigna mungo TaxID=3915 RepID=A0AAQ3RNE4_VIGMU
MLNTTACKNHCMRMRLNAIHNMLICFHDTNKLTTFLFPYKNPTTVRPTHHILTVGSKKVNTLNCVTIPVSLKYLRGDFFIAIHVGLRPHRSMTKSNFTCITVHRFRKPRFRVGSQTHILGKKVNKLVIV